MLPPEAGQLAALLLHLALELQQLHLDVHLQGLGLVGREAGEVEVHVYKYWMLNKDELTQLCKLLQSFNISCISQAIQIPFKIGLFSNYKTISEKCFRCYRENVLVSTYSVTQIVPL